jgi:hypothetical protein
MREWGGGEMGRWGLLKLNNALKPYTDFSLPLISINVPLRYVLFVGWFHYHPRVLDA